MPGCPNLNCNAPDRPYPDKDAEVGGIRECLADPVDCRVWLFLEEGNEAAIETFSESQARNLGSYDVQP